MDQVKIGKFIANRRKAVCLTQMQLAEKLSVSDRAVSKWECGKSMPDSAIMLDLCSILKISVNDLLCGEVISMDDYSKKLEESLIELVKEKEANDRRLLRLEWVIAILSLAVLFIPIFISAYLPNLEDWQRFAILFSGFIPCFVGLCCTIRIEQVAGYYECQHCGHRYVPSYKAVNLAMHMGRKRYMKCPECEKKSWQKKVISKNK
jgi:transcriptional regulator with XRE-family HTH domain